ncbi:MAG: NAD-dependent epimerase/dehydratase family protein [Candidatus Electronema sp. V4]|uniref:NAD-dependent epimerase/dehydratase family protein n=1 Tax=Candidatus Electronema sp. V4 TaxID=3454756 RepID=UPI00405586E7
MKNTVLVTGGAGFIGSWLIKRLLAVGKHVVVLDDLSSGNIDNLPNQNNHLEIFRGSVLDREIVRRAVQDVGLIFHLAGVVGMRLATKQRELSYRIAVEGTEHILQESGRVPTVLFSSSAVYGYTKNGTSAESMELPREVPLEYDGGVAGYATGKWEMEQLGLTEARQGRPILCIRPFNVVGPRQSHAYGMVLPTFVRRALTGKPLYIYDDGAQSRTFSDVGTFIECIMRMIEDYATFNKVGNIINIGAEQAIQIGELAQIVLEETGRDVPIQRVPYHSVFPNRRDVRWRAPNTERLYEAIGTVAWPNIREIVRSVFMDISNEIFASTCLPETNPDETDSQFTYAGQ